MKIITLGSRLLKHFLTSSLWTLVVLEVQPRALCMLGKYSTIELYPGSSGLIKIE